MSKNIERPAKAEYLDLYSKVFLLIQELSGSDNIGGVAQKILQTFLLIKGIDSGAIYIADDVGGLNIIADVGLSPAFLKSVSYMESDAPQVQFFKNNKIRYDLVSNLPATEDSRAACIKEGVRGIALLPSFCEGSLCALLIASSHTHDEIPHEAREALEATASVVTNLFARMVMTAKLKESEERFRTVADFTYGWEYWISPDGSFVYMSPSCKRVTGYSSEEFMADCRLLREIIVPEDRSQIENDYVAETIFSGVHSAEFQIVAKNGDKKWIGHVCQPVYSSEGVFMGRRASNSDITQAKASSEALLNATRLAEESTRAKSEFLANVTHEIRTPMNAIMGFADLLIDSDDMSQENQRKCLETIKDRGDALLALINDILDLSKIEAGKLELLYSDFSVNSLVQAVIELYSPSAASKGVELSFHIDSNVPELIISDSKRLKQILVNLISNAIKFTEIGFIKLRLAIDHDGSLEPGALAKQMALPSCDYVNLKFSVIDTGVGIPEDKLDSIFAAFTQVDGSPSRRFEGTGLGLRICERLIRSLGGRIWVDSELEQGSSFHFTIQTVASGVNY